MFRRLLLTAVFTALSTSAPAAVKGKETNRSLASIREAIRVDHARELLGKHYKKSGVYKVENKWDAKAKLQAIVSKKLPAKHQKWSKDVAKAILEEATRHQLDPMFVAAVIEGESSFNPDARGPVGEIGLMQLRPATGEWIAQRLKIKWTGDKMLNNPVSNIKLGTAYLAWLREKFDGHGQLYVAAYNMGSTNVKKALKRHVWPKDYPRHVMKRYLAYYVEKAPKKI